MLILAVMPAIIASIAGARLTATALVEWYPGLTRPSFTPPNLTFPIVWTMLYVLMALSFWRVLRINTEMGTAKRKAILWFAAQIILNITWSYAFFYLRSPLTGLIIVGLLFVIIAGMIRSFFSLDKLAGYAQIPYLLWVGFASLLNASIVMLNA